jgi:hypothetical protein
MAGFIPTTTSLNTLNELKNLSHTITYTDLLGMSYPVNVTAVDTNSTVNVSGATISGFYTDSFTNDIQYRTPDDQLINVPKWDSIDVENLDELIYYKADTTSRKVYNYTATANGETKSYTVNVDNNWTIGRDQLLYYIAISKGELEVTGINWINNTNATISWINTSGTTINWINVV